MHKKKLTLSRDDQRAIDAVLNHAAAPHPTSSREVAPPSKIRAVNKILALLDSIPATEPPAGLLDRTMQKIEGSQTGKLMHQSTGRNRLLSENSTHFH